ncbi:MAG: OmpA family protein, partial [Chthoniobacterales bacterium]|nr:OmpA family protein [Chthoniobacterales bacterium]
NTSDEEAIRRALEQPVIAKALEDPLLVFVILGYASQTGTSETNLRISRARADFIADFLIKKIQVKNVIYPVPMGASTLFGKDRPHANQAAEIWLVVP